MNRRVAACFACIVLLQGVPAVSAAARLPGSFVELPAVPAPVAKGDLVRAIATFDEVPTRQDAQALTQIGLGVVPMQHLPLAVVGGQAADLRRAVAAGLVRDVYPDEELERLSADSSAAIGAPQAWDLGYTGKGVGIAVVDSGIDATHPDLANRVVRNVKVVMPDPAELVEGAPEPTLFVPFDDLPYNNTDSDGHGTLVAGAAAADGTAHPGLVGVAPGADLIGYADLEAFASSVIAAMDDILATHEQYGIEVLNLSYGHRYRVFDPQDPWNLATKALHDAGITVVHGVGNTRHEMTIGHAATAPWVIAAGGSTLAAGRWDDRSGQCSSVCGSSSGLMFDNSQAAVPDADGHVHFEGDGLGLSHPDVSAPAYTVVSTTTPAGLGNGPQEDPGVSQRTYGTSFSAPHTAGVVALLLEANPELTPDVIQQVLQVTATPMRDGAPFWQSGYGVVDAAAAVELVTRSDFSESLVEQLQAEADARVLAARPYRILRSDQWTVQRNTLADPQNRAFEIEVGEDTEAIRASIAFERDGLGRGNRYEWALVLIDADGNEVATSESVAPPEKDMASVLHVDFEARDIDAAPGTWRVEVVGGADLGLPEAATSAVTLAVVQLAAQTPQQPPAPAFVPTGTLSLGLDGGTGGAIDSPEGCSYDPAAARGELTFGEPQAECRAGGFVFDSFALDDERAEFVSAPLPADAIVGGQATLRLYLVNDAQPAIAPPLRGPVVVDIDAVDVEGRFVRGLVETLVPLQPSSDPSLGEHTLEISPVTVPAGSRLRLQLRVSGLQERLDDAAMRLLWGGEFSASGLDLTTGTFTQQAEMWHHTLLERPRS
ncbi:MAG: S8 family serine peptidase [Actinobacteria bacterium]|nr:S8 family serine peptidase [Actinomycetota bacterium]